MKRKFTLLLAFLLVASLVLASCAQTQATTQAPAQVQATEETQSEEPMSNEVTLTIGFTASQTGNYELSSTRQLNGLQLWMDDVNASGIELSDGTVVKFDSVSYDDESSTERVQELYTRLATEDNADFMISPYSSGLTAAAAVIAEQYGKVLITTGAASDSIFEQGYTRVYQAYTPASRYLVGAIDLLESLNPDAKIAFVHETDKFSTDVVNFADTYAQDKGFEIVLNEGYDSETTDFNPFINKVIDAQPDALLGGGHVQDGLTFARQLHEKNVDLSYIALLVAPPDNEFASLGDAAVGVIGPSQWEPKATFSQDTTSGEWIGPSSQEFTSAYQDAYDEPPTYHAAGGYAAGLILQKAIIDADSTDSDAVKGALDAMDLNMFYGHIKFDTSAESHGLQVGHSMMYIQWQRDDAGELFKALVFPFEGASEEPLYPIP
jgi:ABC-type branched-subunit amino acid transport system substrate-binding protein